MPEMPFSEFIRADEAGVRLEVVGGLPLWEAHPAPRHQRAVDRVRASIRPAEDAAGTEGACRCVHLAGVYVRFPDGSLKRPDISIFRREPEEEDQPVTLLPEAVIEIVSSGYEAKDLEIGPRFCLSQGVKDIVVFDPLTLVVLHIGRDGTRRLVSPVGITLECGCLCEV